VIEENKIEQHLPTALAVGYDIKIMAASLKDLRPRFLLYSLLRCCGAFKQTGLVPFVNTCMTGVIAVVVVVVDNFSAMYAIAQPLSGWYRTQSSF